MFPTQNIKQSTERQRALEQEQVRLIGDLNSQPQGNLKSHHRCKNTATVIFLSSSSSREHCRTAVGRRYPWEALPSTTTHSPTKANNHHHLGYFLEPTTTHSPTKANNHHHLGYFLETHNHSLSNESQ